MKKIKIGLFLLFGLLVLVGCGQGAAEDAESSAAVFGTANGVPQAATVESDVLTTDYENAMPVQTQLMIAPFFLETTAYPVDAVQAQAMLPLYKAINTLSQNDTTAAQELEAVYRQIEQSYTQDQLQSIAAAQLTNQDLPKIFADAGIEQQGFAGGRFGEMTPEQQATLQAARESGQFPGGGAPEGGFPGGGPGGGQFPGGGPGGGQFPGGGSAGNLSPEQQSTLETRRAQGGFGGGARVNTFLVQAVITLLEGKIQ